MGLDGILVGIHGVCVGFLYVPVGFCQGSMGLKKSIRSITDEPDKQLYDIICVNPLYHPIYSMLSTMDVVISCYFYHFLVLLSLMSQ